MSEEIGKSETEELVWEWGWRRDKGSWFHPEILWSTGLTKERSVIFREVDVGGRARETTDEERVGLLRGRWTEMRLWRLGDCENFVGKAPSIPATTSKQHCWMIQKSNDCFDKVDCRRFWQQCRMLLRQVACCFDIVAGVHGALVRRACIRCVQWFCARA